MAGEPDAGLAARRERRLEEVAFPDLEIERRTRVAGPERKEDDVA